MDMVGFNVLTLVVVPGTGCSVAPTEPPWLLRPEAGRIVADVPLPDEDCVPAPDGACANPLPAQVKIKMMPNGLMVSFVTSKS